jgi:hypothetical protein
MTLDDFLDRIVDADIETIDVSARTVKHGNKHYLTVTLETKAGVLKLKKTDSGWIPV